MPDRRPPDRIKLHRVTDLHGKNPVWYPIPWEGYATTPVVEYVRSDLADPEDRTLLREITARIPKIGGEDEFLSWLDGALDAHLATREIAAEQTPREFTGAVCGDCGVFTPENALWRCAHNNPEWITVREVT